MSDIDALTNKIILIGRGQILYNGSFSSIKHKYDNVKQIEVEFKQVYDKIEFDGYEVVSHNQNMATLKNLPTTKFNTKDFINEISKKYEVVDFSIKPISVDEILAKLYTELAL